MGETTKSARYGEWKSPITSELIVAESIRLGAPQVVGEDIFWVEGRPAEKGRQVLVRRKSDGNIVDVTPAGDEFNVRTRVHEYGGGDYLVSNGIVYFSNFKDQRLYMQSIDGQDAPVALTPADSKWRFADAAIDEERSRLVCVGEDHSTGKEPSNSVVAVSIRPGSDPSPPTVLCSGKDFYAAPRISPDGTKLAWVEWSHPSMPWDSTSVMVADIGPDGLPTNSRQVAGGPTESCGQPRWSPSGVLHFISDRTGWWNIHKDDPAEGPVALRTQAAEFAGPDWGLGQRSYQFLPSGDIVCVINDPKQSGAELAVLDPTNGDLTPVHCPYSNIGSLSVCGGTLATLGGSSLKPSAVTFTALPAGPSAQEWTEVRLASKMSVGDGYLSEPQAVEFPTAGGKTSHMLYYPPKNQDYTASDAAPPLLVKSHGGPTGATSSAFNSTIQFWTSRGWAVADVNYGGSTGYGREYRDRLKGEWGVVDVEDVCAAAQHLVSQGAADPARLCIDGGSAGGYTTLACLAFKDVFKAGASYYGIGDLEVLAGDTHKFESRYLDSLVGPYPEDAPLYKARSPINSVDQLDCPVILFQGQEDKVVPPNQAQAMFDALDAKGIPTSLNLFEGEQHGFRQSPNIRRCLDGELYFFSKVFGMECSMPDGVEPIKIHNLP